MNNQAKEKLFYIFLASTGSIILTTLFLIGMMLREGCRI
jgi:hypothetical protein